MSPPNQFQKTDADYLYEEFNKWIEQNIHFGDWKDIAARIEAHDSSPLLEIYLAGAKAAMDKQTDRKDLQ